ncbi:MAG TPA: penicillin-binding transpeptidase domain-containing protein [Miltoncostaeaceae bacterium]|nr:penicillin-binding transpeptidase domain-containing protein [Miltoncostaeaceae bacterium]
MHPGRPSRWWWPVRRWRAACTRRPAASRAAPATRPPAGPSKNSGAGALPPPNPPTEALTNSINTTFAEIGDTLGADRLGTRMSAFGFGERPRIDLPPGEVIASGRYKGTTLLPNAQRGEDAARLAIGQEKLIATPLQMAMVAGAIANGGVLMQPQLMSRIVDRSGQVVRRNDPVQLGQAVSPQVAADLTKMMTDVVRDGTGAQAALVDVGVTVAGKTGTAETGDPLLNNAWFIGFAPADNPRVAVAVLVEATPGQGGSVAAPVAADVMRAALEIT